MNRLAGPIFCATFLACVASSARAADVDVLTVDGKSFRADWVGLDGNGGFDFRIDGKTKIYPQDALTEIVPAAKMPHEAADAEPRKPHRLILADGGQLRVQLGDSEDGIAAFNHALNEAKLPFGALAGVWLMPPSASAEAAELMRDTLKDRPVEEDAVIVLAKSGPRKLAGRLVSLSAGVGRLDYRNKVRTIKPDTLFGVVFGRGVQPKDKAKCQVFLTGGDAFGATVIGVNDKGIALDDTFAGPVVVDWKTVDKLAFQSDAVRYLSDVEPVSYEFQPSLFHARWPYRLDRSVANNPIRIGGREFLKGIGVHSFSRLVYDLNADDATFLCQVGVDDAVGLRGSVRFRVLVDGEERFNSGVIKGRAPGKTVRVDVRRAKRLELVVDDGGDLDVGDQGNWANARLIRK